MNLARRRRTAHRQRFHAVAPVRIGKGAYVAAGSSITEDVPAEALGIARGRQANKEGWARQRAEAAKKS
jgi:bifunctional N-acetylglucosamine-1-phosphate-uridyltransferase/glucosamine-1-phosphate-acetyltransferase GlmU-like protein